MKAYPVMNLGKQPKKVGTYQLLESIGKGANAIVYKGLNNQTGRSVAIKQVTFSEQSQMQNIQLQINILRQLEHQHIVKYIDAIQMEDHLYIILEYIQGGSLASLVKKMSLNQNLVKVYIKQVIEGLDYLHQMGVVHRDIKGANILLTKEGIVKLADFGGAMRLTGDNKTFSMMGTPYWMAPEIIDNKGEISTSCDIWSLGCTIIELLTGKPPYFELLPYPAMLRIVQDTQPPLPEVSNECKQLLLQCLQKESHLRPRASQLLSSSWFQDVDQPQNRMSNLDIRQLIKDRNYASILKNLGNIINKKVIYNNPYFAQILYDQKNEDKTEFILVLVKSDYECIDYFSSIGLFNKIFQCISPTQRRINKLCAQIIYEILDASMKAVTISIFMSTCLLPLKKLFYLQEDKRCIKILDRLFSEEIIPLSHLAYIVCKQTLLLRTFIYLQTILKSNYNEAIKCIGIIERVSSTKQPGILIQFQPAIDPLLNLLQVADRPQAWFKLLKTIYYTTKHPAILQKLQSCDVVPIILNFMVALRRRPLKQDLFDVYYYTLKIINTLSEDTGRKAKLELHGWRSVLEGIQIKEIVKKDIQQIYQHLYNKSR